MRKLIWILFLGSLSALGAPVPPNVPSGSETGATFRLFHGIGEYSLMAEAALINQTDTRNLRQFTFGAYNQALENLKIGLFFRQAYGLRHDEDWVSTAGIWSWQNTNSRAENFLILDVSPRFLLADEWVGEFKTRLHYNTFNNQQTLQIRPGVTYFLLNHGQAFWNFFAQLEANLPLNYGVQSIYEEWAYLGALYNASPGLDLGMSFSQGWQVWGNPAAYNASNGAPYVNTAQTTVISGLLVYKY